MLEFSLGLGGIAAGIAIAYWYARRAPLSMAGVGAGIAVAVASVVLAAMTVEVPGYATADITLWGRYTDRTLGPGLGFKAPWEGVVVVNTSVQALKVQKSDAFTSDKQHALTDYAINYSIRRDALPTILARYQEDIASRIIEPRVEFWLKDIEPKYSAAALIAKRVEVAQQVQRHLDEDLKDKGVDVSAVLITNISFGEEYQKASEALAAAQQELQHQIIETQIIREKARQVADAADGQAKANARIRDSLPRDPREAEAVVSMRMVDLLASKWDGKMPMSLGGGSLTSIGNVSRTPVSASASTSVP